MENGKLTENNNRDDMKLLQEYSSTPRTSILYIEVGGDFIQILPKLLVNYN